MTPAVALSQAALDVTPAYAAAITNETIAPGTTIIPADDWSKWAADYTTGFTTSIAQVNVTNQAELVYSGSSLSPAFEVVVKVVKTDGSGTPVYYSLDNDMYTATPTPSPVQNEGNYTYAIAPVDTTTPATTAPADLTGGDVTVNVAKATPTVNYPAKGIVGVTTPQQIYRAVTLTGVETAPGTTETLTKGTDYTVELVKPDGTKYTNPDSITDAIATAGNVKINITLDPSQTVAKNYSFGGSNTITKTDVISVATEGDYTIQWNNSSPVTTTTQAPTVGVVTYSGGDLETALKSNLTATFTPADSNTSQNVDKSTLGFVWTNDLTGDEVVDTSGQPDWPINPGAYTAKVTAAGDPNTTIATLKLTVQANLSGDVDGTKIDVTVNDRDYDDVLLQYKKGITEADVIEQIVDGLEIKYQNGEVIDDPEQIESLFSFHVNPFVANPDGAGGKVTMTYKGSDGVFTEDPLVFAYAYGKVLPQPAALSAVPYDPRGYEVSRLIPSIKDADGNEIEQSVTVGDTTTVNYVVKAYGADGKEIETSSLTNAGTYTIVVTPGADSDYVGEVEPLTLTINRLKVSDDNTTYKWDGKRTTNGTFSMPFTGNPVTPAPTAEMTVKNNNAALATPGSPYAYTMPSIVSKTMYDQATAAQKLTYAGYVEYSNNTDVTDNGAVATITYTGNYEGTKTQTFSIAASSLAEAEVSAQNQLKTEFPEKPTIADVLNPKVMIGETELEEGVDYEITDLGKGVTAGNVTTYTFTVKGLGNYTGTQTGTFEVTNKDIADYAVAKLTNPEQLWFYGNAERRPEVTVTLKPAAGAPAGTVGGPFTSYEKEYADNVEAGTGKVIVVGTDGYAGTLEVEFQIQPLLLDGASPDGVVLGGADDLVYTGEALKPEVLYNKSKLLPANEGYGPTPILLQNYVDQLTYTYENNTNASTEEAPAYVVISGKTGNFKGSVKVPFTIAQADIAKATIETAAVAPGGSAADAVVAKYGDATLAADTDYTVEAKGTVPGTVAATIAGTGNFTGTVEKDVAVLYDVAKADVAVADAVYTGSAQTPKVEASYTSGGKKVVVDPSAYDVKVDGNATNAGTYKVTVSGRTAAGWTGSVEKSFTISKAAGPKTATVTYTDAGAPVVTVPGLTEGKDFKVTPNPAQKKLVITYTGNYTGSTTVDYKPVGGTDAPVTPGVAKTGWVGSGNDWAYYKNGQQVKNGWELIGGEWYHFEKSGKMTNTKWFQDTDGEWYLLNQSHKGSYGAMLTGWQKVDGGWYYMGSDGAMQSGWAKVNGEWYLLNTEHDGTFGKMLTGWQQVGGKWYYMDASGAMASNEWVGRYWVNGSGVWTATR
ncbi:N-acetylmuramoyl-L-alanine amidase family protein [Xiamenia xianingshaonis]|uniref:N-acetylmuramoyl-L-alanine amidase family protein n=1 Tax=Xiamenia xianingshaonis TaxID=2682776 RepID=UPI00140C52EE|nr:N-acetylmuramoyl-L-alanine amidase family protein [Xiamenia xianingshaonis]